MQPIHLSKMPHQHITKLFLLFITKNHEIFSWYITDVLNGLLTAIYLFVERHLLDRPFVSCAPLSSTINPSTPRRFLFISPFLCTSRLKSYTQQPLLFHLLPFLLGQNLHCPLNAAGQGLSINQGAFHFLWIAGKIPSEDLVLRHWLLADCVWRRSSRGDWDLSSDVLGISLFRSETSSLSPALSIGEPCFRLQCRR
jgi:hypothetical protein